MLRLAQNVTDGLHVNEKIIERTVMEYLPFIATENLMMEAVKQGADRQQAHEAIRRCSMEATARMKNGEACNLPELLARDPEFRLTEEEIRAGLLPEKYIGRCAEQVSQYLDRLRPLLESVSGESAEISI